AVRWVGRFRGQRAGGLAALVVGGRRVPQISGHTTEWPDLLGVVWATAGIGVLTLGLVRGSDWGWGSASIVGSAVGAAVLIGLFVLHCLTSRTPLVPPSLFKSRHFTSASVVALFFSPSSGAMLLSVLLGEQCAWAWSAQRA